MPHCDDPHPYIMLVCERMMRFSMIKEQYYTNEVSILEVIFLILSESNDKSLTVG